MIIISISAQKHFVSLLLKESLGTQIRVFIIHPGTPHAECGVAYCLQEDIKITDVKLVYQGFFVYVDKSILPYLKDSEIDLIIDNLGSQLTLKAPYAKKSIFTRKTILEKAVEKFLNIEINPQLMMHRGSVHLIKITDNGVARIYFSGGCNGCMMIESTLKNMIEKKLLSKFVELKKIRDETNHLHNDHSFY